MCADETWHDHEAVRIHHFVGGWTLVVATHVPNTTGIEYNITISFIDVVVSGVVPCDDPIGVLDVRCVSIRCHGSAHWASVGDANHTTMHANPGQRVVAEPKSDKSLKPKWGLLG